MTEKVKCPACESHIDKIQQLSVAHLDMPYKVTKVFIIYDNYRKMGAKIVGKIFCCSNGHVFNTWDGTEINND